MFHQRVKSAWNVSKYWVFSGPYYPAFGLNTERYGVSLRIQSECGIIRSRKNSIFGYFSRSDIWQILKCTSAGVTWHCPGFSNNFKHWSDFSKTQFKWVTTNGVLCQYFFEVINKKFIPLLWLCSKITITALNIFC